MRKWLCIFLMAPLISHAEEQAVVPVEADAAVPVEQTAALTEAGSEVVAVADTVVEHNPVALVKAGPVNVAIVDRARDWAESQLAIPVPLAESLENPGATFDAVAEEAAKRLTPEDLGVVVLLQSETALPNHGVYRPDLRVVVINMNLMQDGGDPEKFGRRVERQVIRGIGTLMGLELSPNPQSAMAAYSTMDELDQIGRNLDPPWLVRLQKRARELGIPLDPDNPYNLLRE